VNVNFQAEIPNEIFVIAKNNVAKQEVSHIGEEVFEWGMRKKRFTSN
jgi:hypothetical protein